MWYWMVQRLERGFSGCKESLGRVDPWRVEVSLFVEGIVTGRSCNAGLIGLLVFCVCGRC